MCVQAAEQETEKCRRVQQGGAPGGQQAERQLPSPPGKQATERLTEDDDDVGGGHRVFPHHGDSTSGDHCTPHPGQQVS